MPDGCHVSQSRVSDARRPRTGTAARGTRLVAFTIVLTTFKAELRSSLMAQDGSPDTPPGQGSRRVDRTREYMLNLYGSPLRICFCGSRKCFHGHGKAPRQHRGESTSRAPKAHATRGSNHQLPLLWRGGRDAWRWCTCLYHLNSVVLRCSAPLRTVGECSMTTAE